MQSIARTNEFGGKMVETEILGFFLGYLMVTLNLILKVKSKNFNGSPTFDPRNRKNGKCCVYICHWMASTFWTWWPHKVKVLKLRYYTALKKKESKQPEVINYCPLIWWWPRIWLRTSRSFESQLKKFEWKPGNEESRQL